MRNKITSFFSVCFMLLALSLPWTSAEALEEFDRVGVITSIGYDQFTVRDQRYRFAPGARIVSGDPLRLKFPDFKYGDWIHFKGKLLNGVYYVDIIFYSPPTAS